MSGSLCWSRDAAAAPKSEICPEKGISWRSGGAKGALGYSTRGGSQGVARRSKPNTEETEETAQPLSGPAPSPLPVRCFVGLHAAGVGYQQESSPLFLNPTGEASPGGETSLFGAAEHPSDPATEGGGSTGGHQVALDPSPSRTPSSQERAPLFPQYTSVRLGVVWMSFLAYPFMTLTLGMPLQILGLYT